MPAPALPLAIPDRFGDVFGFDGIGSDQIRDGSGDFSYAVVCSAGKPQTVDGFERERGCGA